MRSSLVLLGAIVIMTAIVAPAWAATSMPDPGECAAAAEITIKDWQGRLAKARTEEDVSVAQTQINRAQALRRKLGDPVTPPALHAQFSKLVPDLRDVFVIRCALKHGA